MLTSIALIILFGLLSGALFKRLHLPYIIGMLLTGIILGPYVFNLIDGEILNISSAIRKMALVIILLKAGLSLDINDLKKVGRPAILMCFVPATFEIIAWVIFGPMFLSITVLEAVIIGCVMGAVSPAIIVPRMTKMMEEGWGTEKGIPQMIIGGASADDVYVIVLFTVFTSLEAGNGINVIQFAAIPISIILGIILGIVAGFMLVWIFQHFHMRDTVKVLVLISISFLFCALEQSLNGVIQVSGLLAVMSMGIMIHFKYDKLTNRISGKFSKIWVCAEILLFVLIGTTVDITYVWKTGIMAIIALIIGLLFRVIGTWFCLLRTNLNCKERSFCLISQLPKATVQAAIGGVPLAMGLNCGNLVLTIAVLSIVITAPVGAILVDSTYQKWLVKRE